MRRPLSITLVLAAITIASCGSDLDSDSFDNSGSNEFDEQLDDELLDDELLDDELLDDELLDDGGVDDDGLDGNDLPDDDELGPDDEVVTGGAGGIDLSLTRDDVDCSAVGLGEDELTRFTSAHVVVGGALGERCFGDEDPTLISAWETLSLITPPLQLADLGLFGSFESGEDGDEVTLAFVNALDDDGTLFQMSVNSASFDEDPDEALLTMAHEFSHVFTALPSQIDRSAESAEQCSTYDNGEGCYLPDSLMAQWVELFWGGGLIDDVDPSVEASGDAGDERCALDPRFLGAYAASNPEEDFAETFGAYVLSVDPGDDAVQVKFDWFDDQPGLAAFRDRAFAAGLGPLDNRFDRCGDG